MFTEHHNVAAALLVRDGRVLLCHRHPDRRFYPDAWDIPGGHIEGDEEPVEALCRELAEELGVVVEPANAEPWAVVHPAPDVTLSVWIVRRWHGVVENLAPTEHDQIGWFTPQETERLDLVDDFLSELVNEATHRT